MLDPAPHFSPLNYGTLHCLCRNCPNFRGPKVPIVAQSATDVGQNFWGDSDFTIEISSSPQYNLHLLITNITLWWSNDLNNCTSSHHHHSIHHYFTLSTLPSSSPANPCSKLDFQAYSCLQFKNIRQFQIPGNLSQRTQQEVNLGPDVSLRSISWAQDASVQELASHGFWNLT